MTQKTTSKVYNAVTLLSVSHASKTCMQKVVCKKFGLNKDWQALQSKIFVKENVRLKDLSKLSAVIEEDVALKRFVTRCL